MSTTTTIPSPTAAHAGERRHASLGDVKDDARRLKDDVTGVASDAAHSTIDTVTAGAERAIEVGKHAAESVKTGHGRMCEYVSEHPTTSVLIAAGVGALLARILSR